VIDAAGEGAQDLLRVVEAAGGRHKPGSAIIVSRPQSVNHG
jgi:hypothetical protein